MAGSKDDTRDRRDDDDDDDDNHRNFTDTVSSIIRLILLLVRTGIPILRWVAMATTKHNIDISYV
jgi:hypothetical protein